ncbi:PREDICTED: uncharacterized protein LOC104763388 [Camelina sativa]|uniref:Uncharacterized protein LOC104763388 n=1 Tax=Camelina sativa TaxID=90675 RepID=A0ABM0XF73_CAMSA|nr:PREDICTED: uncharacterized protein LOC104763388 [Camelina sativa]
MGGHIRLWNDYFSENPTYNQSMFCRRFRMNKPLFLRIVSSIENGVPYFTQRPDATGRLGLSALQKCTAAIRMLAYGCAADALDEYLLSQKTYSGRLQQLLNIGEHRGFPGMVGSIDCMHWEWKNCPTAWKGQYARGSGKPTIVLEAVASQDLWI